MQAQETLGLRARWRSSSKGAGIHTPSEVWGPTDANDNFDEPSAAPVDVDESSNGECSDDAKSGEFSLPKTVHASDIASASHDLEGFEELQDTRNVDASVEDPPQQTHKKRAKISVTDISSNGASANQGAVSDLSSNSMQVPSHVVDSAIRMTDKKQLLFPWEKGRLARFFSSNPTSSLPSLPKLQPSASNFVQLQMQVDDAAAVKGALHLEVDAPPKSIHATVVKARVGTSYLEERESKRSLSIKQWCELLSLDWNESDPGRLTVAECSDGNLHQYCIETLDACFGLKSPNTLLKRLYAIKSYEEWLQDSCGQHWLPMQESDAWAYLRFLRETGAPATKATSFLEAVRFSHYVLRASGALAVLESQRIRGRASQLFASKKPWQPAEPLSVQEVLALHRAMNDKSRDLTDRIIVGHMLHMLYSRSRFSDLLAVQSLFIDEDGQYLELQAKLHKGSRNADTRSRLLPIVAPAWGIDGQPWAKQYMALRAEAGLTSPSEEATPMLPAPKKGSMGLWCERYLSSPELNAFMKAFFLDSGISQTGKKLTSHSYKATGLSWASKFGVDGETKAILGRHMSATQGATSLYSRDLISPAMRVFKDIIDKVRMQWFQPDKTRSGMITPPPMTPAFNAAMHGAPGAPSIAPVSALASHAKMPLGGLDAPPPGIDDGESFQPSPATPVMSPPSDFVKLEQFDGQCFSVPDTVDDDSFVKVEDLTCAADAFSGVITIEDDVDLLRDWNDDSDLDEDEGSESESSEDSSCESQAIVQHEPMVVPRAKWYINNTRSLVLHCLKNATHFKCGRICSQTYVIVQELNGLRCGRCFPDAI